MSNFLWRLVVMLAVSFGADLLGAPVWAAFIGSLLVGYLAMPVTKQG